jgi:hypothetical protein
VILLTDEKFEGAMVIQEWLFFRCANRPTFDLGEAGPMSGFRSLVKAGKLEWTVEWLIANDPKWHPLFNKSDWVIEKTKPASEMLQVKTEGDSECTAVNAVRICWKIRNSAKSAELLLSFHRIRS